MPARRFFLSRLATLPFFAAMGVTVAEAETRKPLKIMMKSAWGRTIQPGTPFRFCTDLLLQKQGMRSKSFF